MEIQDLTNAELAAELTRRRDADISERVDKAANKRLDVLMSGSDGTAAKFLRSTIDDEGGRIVARSEIPDSVWGLAFGRGATWRDDMSGLELAIVPWDVILPRETGGDVSIDIETPSTVREIVDAVISHVIAAQEEDRKKFKAEIDTIVAELPRPPANVPEPPAPPADPPPTSPEPPPNIAGPAADAPKIVAIQFTLTYEQADALVAAFKRNADVIDKLLDFGTREQHAIQDALRVMVVDVMAPPGELQ